MRTQIRRGVFESNSSSMHSLCIMKNGGKYTPEEIFSDIWLSQDKETGEECVWDLWYERDLYFGRSPFKAISTFGEKWKYACASMVVDYNDDIYKELERIAIKYIPGLKQIKLPKEEHSIPNIDYDDGRDSFYRKEYGKTEAEFLEFIKSNEELLGIEIDYWECVVDDDKCVSWGYEVPNTGMTDENFLERFLDETHITLEDFISDKKYVVIQDGDEYCIYDGLKKAGLINTDAMEREIEG